MGGKVCKRLDWRRHYNDVRPHSSLNYLTPRQFVGNLSNDLTTLASVSNSSW
ncbi:TPA: transposase [Pseudomonas aeruginosa]|uniref:integrase core domain-containing protein n=1 Tax=Pseudomonadaceae TaxID=135621 RepID=UPI001AEC6D1C|nr:transposase [Pseudomonas aeruginosa]HBP5009043.1 transposase [Pseudomonas aeruginosa]